MISFDLVDDFTDLVPDLVASDLTLAELGIVLCFLPIAEEKQTSGVKRRMQEDTDEFVGAMKSLQAKGLIKTSMKGGNSLVVELDLTPLQAD